MQIKPPDAIVTSPAHHSETELDGVAKQFESLLMLEVFKEMRRTVPDSSMSGGFSQELFTGMLDEELARSVSGGVGLGIGEAIVGQLGGQEMPRQAAKTLQDGQWQPPVEIIPGILAPAQQFGAHRDGLRPSQCGKGHCGLDLPGTLGSPVAATHDGTIASVSRDVNTPGGLAVAIQHAGGIQTRYYHLDSVRADLVSGMTVKAGDNLGALGETGYLAHGPHLHFEILSKSKDLQMWVNPEPILRSAKSR